MSNGLWPRPKTRPGGALGVRPPLPAAHSTKPVMKPREEMGRVEDMQPRRVDVPQPPRKPAK